MSCRLENNSKKRKAQKKARKKGKKRKQLEVFCNFWVLSNLIQKREKPTRIENNNEKNNREKNEKKRKQIEKRKKTEFFATISGFCLIWGNLTIFRLRKRAAAALEALLHVRGSGRPWSFGKNFNGDPHEYTKTAVQAAEDFEMILMIAKMMFFLKNKCFCGLQPVALKLS